MQEELVILLCKTIVPKGISEFFTISIQFEKPIKVLQILQALIGRFVRIFIAWTQHHAIGRIHHLTHIGRQLGVDRLDCKAKGIFIRIAERTPVEHDINDFSVAQLV